MIKKEAMPQLRRTQRHLLLKYVDEKLEFMQNWAGRCRKWNIINGWSLIKLDKTLRGLSMRSMREQGILIA
jgi:hypothetical protein